MCLSALTRWTAWPSANHNRKEQPKVKLLQQVTFLAKLAYFADPAYGIKQNIHEQR